jgi:site-specific DNA-cytosine methylase
MKFCEHMSQLADVFLVGAGSPCQDLSALKAFRLGLGGSQSALFYEVPRIIKLLQKYDRQPVEFFVENVFSMASDQIPKFNKPLGVRPCMIDAYRKAPVVLVLVANRTRPLCYSHALPTL